MTYQTMKLELIQQVGIKQKIEFLLEVFIQLLVQLSDFTLYRRITLAEAFLYVWTGGRAVWYLWFGVNSANFDYFFSEAVWTAFFVAITAFHTLGFFIDGCRVRIIAIYGDGLAWGVLLVLAIYSRTTAPAAPGFLALFMLSFVLLVRLSRRRGKDGDC